MPAVTKRRTSRRGRPKGKVNTSTTVLREFIVEAAMNGHDRQQLVRRFADRLQQAPKLMAELLVMMVEAEVQLSNQPPSPYPDNFPVITPEMTELQAAAAYKTMLDYDHGLWARGLMPRVTERMLEEMSEEEAEKIYSKSLSDRAIASDQASRPRRSKR